MKRRLGARVAAVLLILHGLIEVSAPFALNLMTSALVSFGRMDQA